MLGVTKQIHAGGGELQDRAEFFSAGSSLVITVADGAGGMSGGAEAAEFVVRQIGKASVFDAETLRELLISIDRQMATAGSYGETTCVVAVVSNGKIVGASVGDSGALLVRGAEVDNLTAHQHRRPFIGSGSALPVSFCRDEFQGTLVVASDGLLKYTSSERIACALNEDLEQSARGLVDLLRYPSGALPDDVAIVLARNE